jgi:hypothetical protein
MAGIPADYLSPLPEKDSLPTYRDRRNGGAATIDLIHDCVSYPITQQEVKAGDIIMRTHNCKTPKQKRGHVLLFAGWAVPKGSNGMPSVDALAKCGDPKENPPAPGGKGPNPCR